MPLFVSLLTAEKPSRLAKHFETKNGELICTTCAQVVQGRVEIVTIDDLASFGTFLSKLTTNQALMYGLPRSGRSSDLVTQAMLEEMPDQEGTIARTNRHITWQKSGGIIFLDYDPPKGGQALEREGLLTALWTAVPELARVPMLWWPSSSSHICDAEGRDLTGLRGQRLYMAVADATDIPRLGKVIETRLWAAGYGRYDISKSGTLLARTLVDTSVWQPSRLDFAAGADCGPGLSQRRGLPLLINGDN